MKKYLVVALLMILSAPAYANVDGKDFGFGIVLGDPTGITLKHWLNNENAMNFTVGSSYYGSLRLGVDYLWHFNAFNTDLFNLHAGIGGVLGIGDNDNWFTSRERSKWNTFDDDFGLGARATFGGNFVPRRVPLEIFLELGVIVGVVPGFGTGAEGAVGIRFYP
ncbi:MAG: hypothetical protein ACLFR2_12400 [Candidatus Kapaibacterium sp.]